MNVAPATGREFARAVVLLFVLACAVLLSEKVHSREIPVGAAQWQRALQREAQARFGPNAPVAVLAGQTHQESAWRADAVSPVGARGMAQFMPATANWIAQAIPDLAPADPLDPRWAIRALVAYDAWLIRRNPGATPCDTWAFALSAYNGGEGWLRRDQRICDTQPGCDRTRWFGNVELHTARAPWARRENRHYPLRILRLWAPKYAAAGWGAAIDCSA